MEKSALSPQAVGGEAKTVSAKLQIALDRFANVRPKQLDDEFEQSNRKSKTPKKK